jgi:proteic killer suppression protein
MIGTFGDRDTEHFYHGTRRPGRFPSTIVKAALRKLDMIEAAQALSDLRSPPGNRLEALRGRLDGFHSIRVNDQWRIIFTWRDRHAFEVSLVDYH